MCTFNFIPKFQRRQFSEFFSPYYTLRKFVIFGQKSRSIFWGFFYRNLYSVVLIIPSATFRSVWVPDYIQKKVASWPRHIFLINCYPQFSGKLGERSEPYWPQHIILDVYIQFSSKISTSPAVASSANSFRHTIPLGNLWLLVKNRFQFLGNFFSRNLY